MFVFNFDFNDQLFDSEMYFKKKLFECFIVKLKYWRVYFNK